MADFCRQCSLELFGQDFGDLTGLGKPNDPLPCGYGIPALCEGCGFILVDFAGQCLGVGTKENGKCICKHERPDNVIAHYADKDCLWKADVLKKDEQQ